MMRLPRPDDRSVIIARGLVGASLVWWGIGRIDDVRRGPVALAGAAILWVALADAVAAFDALSPDRSMT